MTQMSFETPQQYADLFKDRADFAVYVVPDQFVVDGFREIENPVRATKVRGERPLLVKKACYIRYASKHNYHDTKLMQLHVTVRRGV